MGKQILVPMDASPQSRKALTFALEEHPDADITLLHVMDFVEAGYGAPMEANLPGYWEQWHEQAKKEAESLFAEARDLAAEYDSTVETETVLGQPARSILEYATEHDVDQIVMGSHGRSGITRVLLGSVAETVTRRADCPVTIVR